MPSGAAPIPDDLKRRIGGNVLPYSAPDGSVCWQWRGAMRSSGYGVMGWRIDGRTYTVQAHRAAYVAWFGLIPDGIELHHTCQRKWCVNPYHLQPIGRVEHAVKHAAERTHCRSGRHLWMPENWSKNGVALTCRPCRTERQRRGNGE